MKSQLLFLTLWSRGGLADAVSLFTSKAFRFGLSEVMETLDHKTEPLCLSWKRAVFTSLLKLSDVHFYTETTLCSVWQHLHYWGNCRVNIPATSDTDSDASVRHHQVHLFVCLRVSRRQKPLFTSHVQHRQRSCCSLTEELIHREGAVRLPLIITGSPRLFVRRSVAALSLYPSVGSGIAAYCH